jgi:hypothetical protein
MDRGASAEEQLKVYEQEENAHDPARVTAVAQWIAKATMAS